MSDAASSPTSTVASPTPPSARTSSATSARMRSASALPSIIVAAILRTYRLCRGRGRTTARLSAAREWLRAQEDPTLSKRAVLREVKTHVVGPMCHVLWAWTTGDAVGPNMMTRNAYALNMGYVMQRAPVKPERAILEANMGGDKKPSYEYFHSGHGKTVLAEAFLADEQIRRVLHASPEDLEMLSWAGTHG